MDVVYPNSEYCRTEWKRDCMKTPGERTQPELNIRLDLKRRETVKECRPLGELLVPWSESAIIVILKFGEIAPAYGRKIKCLSQVGLFSESHHPEPALA
jgi:hypothetical protein